MFVPDKPFEPNVMFLGKPRVEHLNSLTPKLFILLERLAKDKPCSLISPFVNYKLGFYSQHFIFFVTYEWVQQAGVFVPGKSFQPSVM